MGVTEVGLLATILFSFENQTPIIKGGQFIEENGGLVLVAPWGTGSDIPLVNRVQGSVQDGNGGIRVGRALSRSTATAGSSSSRAWGRSASDSARTRRR